MSAKTTTEAAPKLPDFKAGTMYEVVMARSVEFPAGSGNWLRPDHKVTLDGAVAEIVKDAILGAGEATAA